MDLLINEKSLEKISNTSRVALGLAIMLGVAGPISALAATDPGLGAAASFGIVAQTAITGTGSITGNVGINSTGAGITALTTAMVGGTIYSSDAVAPSTAILDPSVQANLSSANGNMSGQGSTGGIGPTLDGLTITPGVYDIGAGRLNGGVLTLDGAGTYILRASSDFISSGSINLTNGARACDVYWQVNTLATINGSSFVGTIVAGTGVHFGSGVTLNGRALALGGDVTLQSTTISGPTCAAALPAPQLIVNKVVVNDSGGKKVISDFPLFIDGSPVVSGVASTTTAGLHRVSETADSGYLGTIGGNCSGDGTITLAAGDIKTCTITNNDASAILSSGGGGSLPPPLIDVVKVPSPLALPAGPGPVKYTYTLHNIGTVPVSNVTMVGDVCSPITLISGDTNGDSKLDVSETWVYTCSTNLTKTTTNVVTATGQANGITATDIANATVVVGLPVVPPLIHVTKIPSPLVLPAGGGMATYINRVTNPGTVALSNIRLFDDKCGPVTYVSGDVNGDAKLDTNEAWVYICRTILRSSTVNTVTASGDANGFTAKDFAIGTIIVNPALPKMPNTGLPPSEDSTPWNVLVPAGLLALLPVLYIVRRKQTF